MGGMPKKGAWTVCRFKGGGWLGKKKRVVFLRGLIPQCTLCFLFLFQSLSFSPSFRLSSTFFLCLSSILERFLTALEIYFIEIAVPYITIASLTVLLNEDIAFGCPQHAFNKISLSLMYVLKSFWSSKSSIALMIQSKNQNIFYDSVK